MKTIASLSSFALLALSSMSAFARDCYDGNGNVISCTSSTVPEPGALALLAIGAGAAAIVWARGRNKK